MLYKPASITSVLREVDDEVAWRLSQPETQPEREQTPGLQSLLEKTTTEYLKKTNGGVPGIRTMNRPSRRGGERGSEQ